MVYIKDSFFFQDVLCYINKKNKGVSIFVSILHCPMDSCIPACSTVFLFYFILFIYYFFFVVVVFFFFFLFFFCFVFFIEQGLACNSVE